MKQALCLGVALIGLARAGSAQLPPPPPTQERPVTNIYFGTPVIDDYQWLENFNDPAVKSWTAAENRYSATFLDALPARAAIARRLLLLADSSSAQYFDLTHRPGVIFALKSKPPAQQPWLVRMPTPDDPTAEWTVVDPNRIDPNGATAIDWFVPSLDGRFVAVSFSRNGSEDGTIVIYDVASGQPLPDRIPRAQYPTAGGSAAWNADGTGLYYTRYPAPGERPPADLHFYQQVYFHRLGTPSEQDRLELGHDLPRIAEIALETRKDGRYTLASVANGDGGEFEHFLRGPDGQWTQLTRFSDGIRSVAFGEDEALYFLSQRDAPRGKVLRAPLDHPDPANGETVIKESEGVIESICPITNGIYASLMVGGPSELRLYETNGYSYTNVPVKPVSSVSDMVLLDHDQLLFRNTTFIEPYVFIEYNPATGQSRPTALAGSSPVDFTGYEVRREFAISRDGTKIPLNIICRKGTMLDSNNPVILYGYGGYGINLTPTFSLFRAVWLEQGGIYAVANLRGGAEYGEAWHLAGNLTHKQNVFDDFAACAEHLINRGYTKPARLGVEGASNGGLLMGAFLTQHPELARAVVSSVGIYDSLRSELEPNGAFNVTEYGTVKNEDQFRALYAYSPYHHVVNGVPYPAILMMTGDHDGRVNPYNSRKMIARLQAANASDHPILLRTTAAAGHGIGTALAERIAQEADKCAFFFDQLGVRYVPVQ